jgi:hypothetical protein
MVFNFKIGDFVWWVRIWGGWKVHCIKPWKKQHLYILCNLALGRTFEFDAPFLNAPGVVGALAERFLFVPGYQVLYITIQE